MGLTRISGDVIQTPLNVGVVTVTSLTVGTGVTISGGIVTATSFIGNVTGNINSSGISTFITRVAIGTNTFAESIDLDGILLVKRDIGLARVRVRNNGNSSSDFASFNLKTGVADWSLYTNATTNYFRIYDVVAGAARVHIDSSGNVGINSTTVS